MGNKPSPKLYKMLCLLPKHKGSIRAAAKEAGYAPSTYNSGIIYKILKNQTVNPMSADLFKPDAVKQSILEAEEHYKNSQNKGDNFCHVKMIEMRAKVSGVMDENKNQFNFALFGNVQQLKDDIKKELKGLPDVPLIEDKTDGRDK
jgi:hypothetical protein